MSVPVRYRVMPVDPHAHLFEVRCLVWDPDSEGQLFSLPAWIPGSYMIRDFARNIVAISARCGERAIPLVKLDKHTWRAAPLPSGHSLEVICEVYAWDLSVRGAHLDQTHGFFNGTSLFLRVHGQEDRICLVDLLAPPGELARAWRVSTSMSEADGEPGAAARHGFGCYRAVGYEDLIDHPVEMGVFASVSFDVEGACHEVAITGRQDADLGRLQADLQRICSWHVALFGNVPPMQRYVFLVMLAGEAYGGLEHRASTALLASRNDLPQTGMQSPTESYIRFLGLCSHEYFHAWMVKRIRPQALMGADLSRECHTRLLWAFEGFTSYYDDLCLVRSAVIARADYLGLLAKTIGNVLRGSGRFRQSVAESSFDAWTKYYRQDENAPNAIVSYYAKGSLIALALDLQLRLTSDGERSLDDVMRLLWQRHGLVDVGVPEDGVFAVVANVGGKVLAQWLERSVEGTDDLPLERWFRSMGVELGFDAASSTPELGVKLGGKEGDLRIAEVWSGGAAEQAGLAAGDQLVALDGLRLSGDNIDALLARRSPGTVVRLHVFRRDELLELSVRLAPPSPGAPILKVRNRVSARQKRLLDGWLGTGA